MSKLDSSKDLEKDEKDEREFVLWADHAWTGLPFNEGEIENASLNVVPKARLQQVEAERDRVPRLSWEGRALDAAASSDRNGREVQRLRAELSIAREALEDALEGLRDMIAYVPEQFQEKWEHPGYIEHAEAVLVRLQAKGART